MKNIKLIRVVIFVAIPLVCCILTLVIGPLLGPYLQHIIEEQRYKAAEPMRHLLFCENLKPGLSEEETLKIVSQFGTYTYNINNISGPIGETHIAIDFDDYQVQDQFGGGFVLVIRNRKYQKAMIYAQQGDSGPTLVSFKCDP